MSPTAESSSPPSRSGAGIPATDPTNDPGTDSAGAPRVPEDFYRSCLQLFLREGIDFVIGGAFALRYYTGITRNTKDLDIFIRPEDVEHGLTALESAGYQTKLVNAGWLAKTFYGDTFIDIIFRSGNGIAVVDSAWFTRAETVEVFGLSVPVTPVEEAIWSKAFTMERERFDLADIAHMIQARGKTIDWDHLRDRFGPNWRVLLSHLILYGFIYPGERDAVPQRILDELTQRLIAEGTKPIGPPNLCQGTLLSGSQYLVDVLYRGYQDARFCGGVDTMSTEDLRAWKRSIENELANRLKDAGFIPSREHGKTPSSG